jgi:FKBP-type peptidyl-prolyl cis-trans isomerase FkpA
MNKIVSLIGIVLFLASCGSNETQDKKPKVVYVDSIKKPLENVNKKLVKNENQEIKDFIARYNWNMSETGTGLRYLIYKKGNGASAKKGKIAKFNYEVKLITGEVCYSSKTDGPQEFLIGKGGVVSGLEEGILLLKVGDKAKFIIPSHLAFGLLGDEDKVPKRATLVYDLELLEVK